MSGTGRKRKNKKQDILRKKCLCVLRANGNYEHKTGLFCGVAQLGKLTCVWLEFARELCGHGDGCQSPYENGFPASAASPVDHYSFI